MKNSIKIFGLLLILPLCCFGAIHVSNTKMTDTDQSKVIAVVKKAGNYIKKYGKEKAIVEFKKNSGNIFMGD